MLIANIRLVFSIKVKKSLILHWANHIKEACYNKDLLITFAHLNVIIVTNFGNHDLCYQSMGFLSSSPRFVLGTGTAFAAS